MTLSFVGMTDELWLGVSRTDGPEPELLRHLPLPQLEDVDDIKISIGKTIGLGMVLAVGFGFCTHYDASTACMLSISR